MASVDDRLDKLEQQMQKILDKLESGSEKAGDVREVVAAEWDALNATVSEHAAQLAALHEEAVLYGARVALRMHSQKLMMPTPDGGPTGDREPIVFETRDDPGPWESFKVERGTA